MQEDGDKKNYLQQEPHEKMFGSEIFHLPSQQDNGPSVRPIYSGFTVFITALPPNLKISYKEKKERKKETARRSDTYKLLIMIKVEVSSSSSNLLNTQDPYNHCSLPAK